MPRRRAAMRGASLIEALVALTVMAFGMLGLAGLQSTLRLNAEVAKQRAEAVRLAQQSIEDARSFVLVAPAGSAFSYSDIGALSQAVTGFATNTPYTLTREVLASGDSGDADDARLKSLRVTVSWADRSSASGAPNQSVELNTAIARAMPELGGALSLAAAVGIDGVPTRSAHARHPAIPLQAVDFGNGSSGYIPPGRPAGDTTAWRFDNRSGLVTLCTTALAANDSLSQASQLSCSAGQAWPLSGFVAFAAEASVAQALAPTGAAQAVQVALSQTFPTTATVRCYSGAAVGGSFVPYACAIPVTASSTPPSAWSGTGYVVWPSPPSPPAGLSVCRYTGTAAMPPNPQHPLVYEQVNGPLAQQNYLVVPGTACPGPVSAAATTALLPAPPAGFPS